MKVRVATISYNDEGEHIIFVCVDSLEAYEKALKTWLELGDGEEVDEFLDARPGWRVYDVEE